VTKESGHYGLHQFLFADQLPGVFHEVFEGFVYLGAKLDLLARFQQTPLYAIEREFAELIV
jgi:hypothetical protein